MIRLTPRQRWSMRQAQENYLMRRTLEAFDYLRAMHGLRPWRIEGARFAICQWILGKPTRNARKCGAPVKPGSSYCPRHHSICWISIEEIRERRAALAKLREGPVGKEGEGGVMDEDFKTLVRVCRAAFERRHVAAREKTVVLRDRYLAEEVALRRRAALVAGRNGGAHRGAPRRAGSGEGAFVSDGDIEGIGFVLRKADELHEKAAALEALLKEFRHANLLHDEGPTPEAMVKPERKDSLARLVERGSLDPRHAEAGRRIVEIFHAVTRALLPGGCNPDSAARPPRKGWRQEFSLMPDWAADLHRKVYIPWAAEMGRDKAQNLPLVMDVCVDGYSLYEATKRRRVGWKKGLRQLREGLELFVDFNEARPQRAA